MNKINNIIKNSINECIPNSFGKIGGIEASHIQHYLRTGTPVLTRGNSLAINAGIATASENELRFWCESYIESIENLDYVLEWCPEQGDKYILDSVWKGKEKFSSFDGLEPFVLGSEGWHFSLSEKNILVVSPFRDSIMKQFERMEKIWPGVSPADVHVVKSPFPPALLGETNPKPYYYHLEEMKNEIAKVNFDFATVGAGGYSLILLDFIKNQGKPCVHLGGSNQILFGIRGKRWDNNEKFVNSNWYGTENWIRPFSHEVPPNAHLVENACYW